MVKMLSHGSRSNACYPLHEALHFTMVDVHIHEYVVNTETRFTKMQQNRHRKYKITQRGVSINTLDATCSVLNNDGNEKSNSSEPNGGNSGG